MYVWMIEIGMYVEPVVCDEGLALSEYQKQTNSSLFRYRALYLLQY